MKSRTTPKVNVRDGAAIGIERDRDGNQRRRRAEAPGDRRGAILLHRSNHFAEARQLARRHQAGQHDLDFGARHRELRRPEVVQRVAECIHAIAVDVRDRAGRAKLEVSGQQAHADGVAGLQRPAVGGRRARAGRLRVRHRHEAGGRECRRDRVEHRRIEARCDHRHRDRPQHRAHARQIRRRRPTGPAPGTVRRRTVSIGRDRATRSRAVRAASAGATSRPDASRAARPSSSSRRAFRRSA